MFFTSLFDDGPEYTKRKETPFTPIKATLAEVHAAVPKHLHQKNTLKGLSYVARDIFFYILFLKLGWKIDPFVSYVSTTFELPSVLGSILKWSLWAFYWHWQGVVLGGFWCLAHEAGHGSLSNYGWVNTLVGYSLHTYILAPYWSWRSTHHAHHKATNSIERDENFVPRTRNDYGLPPAHSAHLTDYHEVFEETPIYSLARIMFMQILGWQYYLLNNALGSPMYPPGTNHFQPSSLLFKPHERNGIIASNIGISFMASLLFMWTKRVGIGYFFKLYFVPYLLANHWVVMLTYLHHSDPTIAHYRNKQWSFLRGAVSTVDRPLLGWAGRFFLHNVSHDHVAHHLFSGTPFYNQPYVTEAIKTVLKTDHNYDSTNTFRALYRSFTQCCFIEDEGDIVFYKNKDGKMQRVLADGALDEPMKKED